MGGSPTGRRPVVRGALAAACMVAAAVSSAGCAGQEQSGTPAHQVSTWLTGAGGVDIGNLEVASRNVDLALTQHNQPAAIREVCDLLSNDAQTGIGDLPTPDSQLTDELNRAYTVATSAGGDCYDGAAGNGRLLARSAAERRQLFVLLGTAVRRIETITGQTPTTDTTAPPDDGDPFAGGT